MSIYDESINTLSHESRHGIDEGPVGIPASRRDGRRNRRPRAASVPYH